MPRGGSRSGNIPVGAAAALPEGPEGGGLKRAITPGLLLFFIVGDILGGGIYARVGQVAGETGGAIWIAFLLALVMAAFTAGSYAELVGQVPARGRGGPLRPPSVRQLVLHLRRRVRGRRVGHRIGQRAGARVRRRLPQRVRRHPGGPHRDRAPRADRRGQPARHRGVREDQRRLHARRDGWPRAHRHRGVRRDRRRRRRAFARVRDQGGRVAARRCARGRRDRVLRADRLRGLGQRRRGDAGPGTDLPEGAVRRAGDRGRAVPARDDRRVDGRAHVRARGLGRGAARGHQAGAARDPREALLRDRPARAVKRRADQHDHGLAAALRDGAGGRRAAPVRPRALRAPHAVVRDRVHVGSRGGARRDGRSRRPRRHDRGAARRRLRDRQRLRARPAPRPGGPRPLRRVDVRAGDRGRDLARAADADRGRDLRSRGDPRRGRHRAVGRQLAGRPPSGRDVEK